MCLVSPLYYNLFALTLTIVSFSFPLISSNFVPLSLPPGTNAIIPAELQASVNETLAVMSKVNFSSLDHKKSIEWNFALSKTCLRFSQEMSLLKQHQAALRRTAEIDAESQNRAAFAKCVAPLIKKHCYIAFSKLVFPSHLEVTTTAMNGLAIYGLTSTCALAKCIFDDVVFKQHGSCARDSISIDNKDSCCHPFDTPQIRDDLWVNHGIGSLSVQEVGRVRNTVTNICREATSK